MATGEIQRDEQYWYSTGDIVLVANHQVAFKVYVGLLTKESAVFRYLVNKDVPQPEHQESIDNCPVIHLTDDPQDLRTFLAFIYDGWRYVCTFSIPSLYLTITASGGATITRNGQSSE